MKYRREMPIRKKIMLCRPIIPKKKNVLRERGTPFFAVLKHVWKKIAPVEVEQDGRTRT